MDLVRVNPDRITADEYRQTSEAVERSFPELWAKCYPRRYEETGRTQYDTPKAVARAMMDSLLVYHGLDGRSPGTTEQNEALWASMMAKFRVPTYYLSHDIAVALTQTTPTEALDWKKIKFPFEAAAFMLPKDVFTHGEYGPVSFVAYGRALTGQSFICPHPVPAVTHDLDIMNDSFGVFLRTANGMMLHWTFSDDMARIDLRKKAEFNELQDKYSHISSNEDLSQEFTPADKDAMYTAIGLVFNLVLFITHKPELVEPAQLLKRVRKGPGQPIEYWKPHIIGRTYRLRYERHEATGTHASPRGHWVSGFWREQPYGPRAEQRRKTLWIEPFWRGGQL